MKVKQKYCCISEPLLFEFTLNESRMNFNRGHYAYWMSIKELDVKELDLEDLVRIGKIEDLHNRTLKRPNYKRR